MSRGRRVLQKLVKRAILASILTVTGRRGRAKAVKRGITRTRLDRLTAKNALREDMEMKSESHQRTRDARGSVVKESMALSRGRRVLLKLVKRAILASILTVTGRRGRAKAVKRDRMKTKQAR